MTFGMAILMKKPRMEINGTTQYPPLPTVSSIRDLAGQEVIKYGVLENGSTAAFFRDSKDPAYERMWQKMSSNADYGLVPTTAEAVRRVRDSHAFAFITEGTTASYHVQRKPCNLVSVDGKMDTRHYALAVRHDSELKAKLDEALTQMKDDGELKQLYDKWWIERSECSAATSAMGGGSLVIALLTALVALVYAPLSGSP